MDKIGVLILQIKSESFRYDTTCYAAHFKVSMHSRLFDGHYLIFNLDFYFLTTYGMNSHVFHAD